MNSAAETNPYELAKVAADFVVDKFGSNHDILAVLGSGWAHAASVLKATNEISVTEIPGFTKPSAIGHGGSLKSVLVGKSKVLLLTGRTHLYEGGVGATALISDHINLTGFSPLTGADAPAPLHGRFVDLTDAYSLRLRKIAHQVDSTLHEGVYMGFHGPHFETPAEIRAARVWGADLVGMSTVMETIAARHMGMEVLALSLATNLAAGISGEKLSGEEVLAIGKASATRVGGLLANILKQIDIESQKS
ncbi:MAG: purine-nucleoside phosphorylase [Actinobacteria bacterium]|nr:purine-nucleoside phosphorylase [Actinomycetota bacterium]